MLFPQDPVLNELYAVFRGYWPSKKSESMVLAKHDGYDEAIPETNEATPDADPQEHGDDEPDDTDLAKALGVPTSCVSKMSPSKTKVVESGNHDGAPLSMEEQRALRVLELKFRDSVVRTTFLYFS